MENPSGRGQESNRAKDKAINGREKRSRHDFRETAFPERIKKLRIRSTIKKAFRTYPESKKALPSSQGNSTLSRKKPD